MSRLTRAKGMEVRGRGLEAGDAALAIRADIPPRALVKGRERIVAEARPHLGLPAAVEVFDGGLESALLRRHKDWGDVEAQARPHDTAQDILPVVAALEDGVAVELSVGRPPELPPVLHERLRRGFRGHQRLRLGVGQPPMQGHDVEDLEADTTHEGPRQCRSCRVRLAPPLPREGTTPEAAESDGPGARRRELHVARGCARSFAPTVPGRGFEPGVRGRWPGPRTHRDRSSPSTRVSGRARDPLQPTRCEGPSPRSADDRSNRPGRGAAPRHGGTTTARWKGSRRAPALPPASICRP